VSLCSCLYLVVSTNNVAHPKGGLPCNPNVHTDCGSNAHSEFADEEERKPITRRLSFIWRLGLDLKSNSAKPTGRNSRGGDGNRAWSRYSGSAYRKGQQRTMPGLNSSRCRPTPDEGSKGNRVKVCLSGTLARKERNGQRAHWT